MWSFVLFAVSLVVSYLTRPKPSFAEPDPSSIADFDIPTADESRPIPVIFGDVWISGANVVWYGDLDIDKIQEKVDTGWFSSKHITVGYKYSLGIHFVLGHGPMDALVEIRVGDQQVWPARDESLTRADLIPYFYRGSEVGVTEEEMLKAVPAIITETALHGPATDNGQFYIFAPSLFGGDKNEGGVQGRFSLMMGAADQAPNAYLTGHLDDVPAYRGVTSLVAEGCYIGTTPYLKPWKFRVRRLPGLAWYSATADIGGHANPAHIIRECLTDGHWGLGYPESQIDDAVFRTAADRLHADGLAMSLQWTQQETCEAFIQRVLNHIDGALMTDLSTGLWQLKLVRDDYDVETLPTFDESSVISLDSYQRPGWSDVVNQVAVTYRDHAAGKDATVSVSNLGTIQVQGQIVPTTRDYRGFPTADLALRAASRDLRTISTPLARIQLTMDRRAWHLGIADVFRLTWPDLGLEHIVFRVIDATTGTLTDGRIRVRAVQDVFTLPSGGYTAQQPTGWVDPVHAPALAPYRNLAEATYRQIINEIVGAEQWAQINATAGFLTVQAARPSRDAFDYSLAARADTDSFETTDDQPFTPTALLAADAGYLDTTIALSEIDDIRAITMPCITYLGAELIRVTDITDTAATVERGLLDTVPAPHAAGERLWFVGAGQGVDDTTAWADNAQLDVRVLPRTPKGALALSDAPADTLTMAHRAIRPFAPGRLRINGDAYPQEVSGPLVITWAHRDRTAEIDTLASEASGDIGPEPGTTYRVTITDDNDVVLTERQDIAGTLFQDDPAAEDAAAGHIAIRLEAERDGWKSWQAHEIAVHRIGWTFSWDNAWGDDSSTYVAPKTRDDMQISEITLTGTPPPGMSLWIRINDWIITAYTITDGDALTDIAEAIAAGIRDEGTYLSIADGTSVKVGGTHAFTIDISTALLYEPFSTLVQEAMPAGPAEPQRTAIAWHSHEPPPPGHDEYENIVDLYFSGSFRDKNETWLVAFGTQPFENSWLSLFKTVTSSVGIYQSDNYGKPGKYIKPEGGPYDPVISGSVNFAPAVKFLGPPGVAFDALISDVKGFDTYIITLDKAVEARSSPWPQIIDVEVRSGGVGYGPGAGSVITIKLNGTAYDYDVQAGDSSAVIAAGLVDAINQQASAFSAAISPEGNNVVRVTAATPNDPFDYEAIASYSGDFDVSHSITQPLAT